MSQFSGKQFKGAMKARRSVKREEAEGRNSRAPIERTRDYREGRSA